MSSKKSYVLKTFFCCCDKHHQDSLRWNTSNWTYDSGGLTSVIVEQRRGSGSYLSNLKQEAESSVGMAGNFLNLKANPRATLPKSS